MSFPKNFVWGAAASSYQIEGAWNEDGKGLSVWDVFSHTDGKVWQNQNGDTACDHYHRYEEDVELMSEIGLQAYRLSLTWSRILPDGVGRVSEKGLDFYDKLIDSLLANNITPYVTLFHWDYPYELFTRGGWLNRDSAAWFAEYTEVVVKKLGDRVRHWMTHNEPAVFVNLGHLYGIHAPGEKWDNPAVLHVVHNVLRAHGMSVQAIRAHSPQPCEIGIVPNADAAIPASNKPEDIEAARQDHFSVGTEGFWSTATWIDPIIKGEYPADMLAKWGKDMPTITAEDMAVIQQPLDFIGLNIYHGHLVQAGEDGTPETIPYAGDYPRTLMEWPVTPEALYWGAIFAHERYQKPLYITENGLSLVDWVALDGKVHDANRIDFLTRYLQEFRRAGEDGADIRGYFQWSIMDNFEWAEGYKQRFGLIYVDFETKERTLKDSAYWYGEVIKSNGENLG